MMATHFKDQQSKSKFLVSFYFQEFLKNKGELDLTISLFKDC